MRLNLGSGVSGYRPGWKNIDIWSDFNPDECYDVSEGIREPDDSVDEIFMGDFLEHIQYAKTGFVLKECFRVLKRGGVIRISVPDMAKAMPLWLHARGLNRDLSMLIWGQQGTVIGSNFIHDSHFNGFTEASLRKALEQQGLKSIKRVGINNTWFELGMEATK